MTDMSPETVESHLNQVLKSDEWEHVQDNWWRLPLVAAFTATEINVDWLTEEDASGPGWVANIRNGSDNLFDHVASSPYEALSGVIPYLDLLKEMAYRAERLRETRVVQLDDNERVETGPVKFIQEDGYEDWSGVFIRGDGALYYSFIVEDLISEVETLEATRNDFSPHPVYLWQLRSLARLLASCSEI